MISPVQLAAVLCALSILAHVYRGVSAPPWDPTTPLPFPEQEYAQAAGCTQQTYCPASNLPGLQVGDATLLWTVGDSDTQQRVNVYRSSSLGLVIAYAGTNVTSKTSMAVNDDFLLTKGDDLLGLPFGAKVEAGAQTAWRSTWDQVIQTVQREEEEDDDQQRITVTGHSMGAQLAILASVALQKLYGGRIDVITFGQPRVGNKAFADHIDALYQPNSPTPHLSFVINGHDFTSRLPPTLLGYRQFSGQIFVYPGNSSNYRVLKGQENPQGALSDWWPGIRMDDHQGSYMGTTLGDIHACPAKVGDRLG